MGIVLADGDSSEAHGPENVEYRYWRGERIAKF